MKPVPIPKGVTIDLKGQNLKVKVRQIEDRTVS
jgi:ribosomal protein L6P/L9E